MSDPVQGTPTEQSLSAPDGGQAEFYGYTHPDGSKDSFKTKEDLDKAWKESYFKHKDYTQKTQAIAEYKRSLEEREKTSTAREKEIEERHKEVAKYNQFFKARPQVYRQLQQAVNKGSSIGESEEVVKSMIEEALKPYKEKIDVFDRKYQDEEMDRQKAEIFTRLKDEFPDIDSDAIEEEISNLSEGGVEAIMRMVYHGIKGRTPIEGAKRQAAEKIVGAPKLPPVAGKVTTGKYQPKSLDEAENLALQALRGG